MDDDDIEAVARVLRSDRLTTGPVLRQFEEALAERVGAAWAVGVSSGTAALHGACHALGLGPGDEVLVPAMSFAASANCVRYLGADPVFVDVDPRSGLMTTDAAEARRTLRTRAVMVVHLGGAVVDAAALGSRLGLPVIEDAAHALGATYGTGQVGDGRRASLAAFSLHPVKTITSAEGGVVTGQDPELERSVRAFRHHGVERLPSVAPWYYEQRALGYNYRLSDVHAALGLSQLGKLERFLDRRRSLADAYDRKLQALEGVTPVRRHVSVAGHGHHLYAVLVDWVERGADRARVMTWLRERGIGTQVHYIPIPAHPYYRDRGWNIDDFPGAKAYYERTLSLPLHPAMQDRDVDRVVSALEEALRDGRNRPPRDETPSTRTHVR